MEGKIVSNFNFLLYIFLTFYNECREETINAILKKGSREDSDITGKWEKRVPSFYHFEDDLVLLLQLWALQGRLMGSGSFWGMRSGHAVALESKRTFLSLLMT